MALGARLRRVGAQNRAPNARSTSPARWKCTSRASLNRKRTWTLDGVEQKIRVRVADAGSYNEIASARIDNGRIVLMTGRDRGGQIAREERVLYRKGDKLIVEAKSWVGQKVIRTSTLTYHRSASSTN